MPVFADCEMEVLIETLFDSFSRGGGICVANTQKPVAMSFSRGWIRRCRIKNSSKQFEARYNAIMQLLYQYVFEILTHYDAWSIVLNLTFKKNKRR